MKVEAIQGGFGAQVSELSFADGDLAATARSLQDLLDKHLLLVLGAANLDEDEFVALGHAFGELEDFKSINMPGHTLGLSNLTDDGRIREADDPIRMNIAADALWHTDHTYMVKRARYSFLKAERLPASGGETQFADTRAAYDALPPVMKQHIDGRVALHSIVYSRSLVGVTIENEELRNRLHPVPQPLVFENPKTGRKSLYIASHIAEISGLPTAEARALASELIGHATQPRFVYSHCWQPGDIAVWDDRATMHRRAPYDDLNEVRQLRTMRVLEPSNLYDPNVEYAYN